MVKLGKDEEIWTRIDIDNNQLREEAKTQSAEIVQEVAKRVGPNDLKVLAKGITLPKSITLANSIQAVYDRDFDRFMEIYYISEFIKLKTRALDQIARIALKSQPSINIDETSDLALAYLLFKKNPMLLFDVYLRNQVINRSFDEYNLECTTRSRPKKDLRLLTEEIVNQYLQDVDKKFGDSKSSKCWHVSQYSDSTELYIRREDEAVLMRKLVDNVPEIISKSVILRFDKYGRNVDLWAEKDSVAKRILNHLAIMMYDKNASYQAAIRANDASDVEMFLVQLMQGQDKKMKLLRIKMTNAPLEGSPKITLESDKAISKAIEDLIASGIDLTIDCRNNTEEIKIRFGRKNYYFGFKVDGPSIIIITKRQQGTSSMMTPLNDYLKKTYNIEATCGS